MTLQLNPNVDGFILEKNKWDFVALDHFFTEETLPPKKRAQLENAGYLGYIKHLRQSVIL